MKKIIYPLFLFVLFSCNPKEQPGTVLVTPADSDTVASVIVGDNSMSEGATATGKRPPKNKIHCDFGFKKFNNRKRDILEAPGGVKGKKPKPQKPPTDPQPPPDEPPTDPPTTSDKTIYLDFWGATISGTMWNTNGTFTVGDAGLAQPEIDQVVANVQAHYAGFNVTVTTDESVFNATPIGQRTRVLITETYQWFGQAGGVAYIGSFTWTDNSPAFVFSLLLNYNAHNIGEAAAHEAGHTLGLWHQSDCSGGVVTNQYSLGKTMGNSYYKFPIGDWVIGTSSRSCVEQNDRQVLGSILGLK